MSCRETMVNDRIRFFLGMLSLVLGGLLAVHLIRVVVTPDQGAKPSVEGDRTAGTRAGG
jgi:hypothetical protein